MIVVLMVLFLFGEFQITTVIVSLVLGLATILQSVLMDQMKLIVFNKHAKSKANSVVLK